MRASKLSCFGIVLAALGLSSPTLAMGYDSLACPELGERRIGYFTNNGFCDPAKKDAKDCKPMAADSEVALPEADKTQVQMIIKVEVRKSCPAK